MEKLEHDPRLIAFRAHALIILVFQAHEQATALCFLRTKEVHFFW